MSVNVYTNGTVIVNAFTVTGAISPVIVKVNTNGNVYTNGCYTAKRSSDSLKCYLKRTKKLRDFGQDQAKLGLVLSFMEPHKPLTCRTISKWLVRVIKMAYDDSVVSVKGHSARAIGPSWALFNGASIEQYFRGSRLVEGLYFCAVLFERFK